jgi:hypothetical protein
MKRVWKLSVLHDSTLFYSSFKYKIPFSYTLQNYSMAKKALDVMDVLVAEEYSSCGCTNYRPTSRFSHS